MRLKNFIIPLLIVLSNCFCYAQQYNPNLLIPYRQKNLWGYCDTLGNIKIKPAYDSVSFFNEYSDVTKVFSNKRQSFIKPNGELLFPFHDDIIQWDNDTYFVKVNNKWGQYNFKGVLVVPLIYDKLIATSNYRFYANETNKVIGQMEGKYYLIDYLKNSTKEIANPATGISYAIVEAPAGTETDYSQIKQAPAWILKQVDSIKVKLKLDSASVIVQKGYYNSDIYDFKYYKIYKNKKVGLWNLNFIILPKFDGIKAVYDENIKQIIVEQKGFYGVINEKEDVFIPIAYSNILRVNANIFLTTKKKKQGATLFNSFYKNIDNKYDFLILAVNLFVNDSWSFALFYGVKENNKGYIGENGVEYFKD